MQHDLDNAGRTFLPLSCHLALGCVGQSAVKPFAQVSLVVASLAGRLQLDLRSGSKPSQQYGAVGVAPVRRASYILRMVVKKRLSVKDRTVSDGRV